MKVIYENQVKASGVAVKEFKDAGMFIIFGDNAPEEIKDYCYSVSVNPINEGLLLQCKRKSHQRNHRSRSVCSR